MYQKTFFKLLLLLGLSLTGWSCNEEEGSVQDPDSTNGGSNSPSSSGGVSPNGINSNPITDSSAQSNISDSELDGPSLTSVTPKHVSTAGGTTIFIFGDNFEGGMYITIGTKECADIVVSSENSASCTTPSFDSGSQTVNISVDGQTKASKEIITYFDPLELTPRNQNLTVNTSLQFTPFGGVAPYHFTASSGSIDDEGIYISPGSEVTAEITLTDSIGNEVITEVFVTESLSISPSTSILAKGNSMQFTAAGGQVPHYFQTSGGTIDQDGNFTAPNFTGTVTITLTDDNGDQATATVTVNDKLAISPTAVNVEKEVDQAYTASGGVPPYTYEVSTGGGSFSSNTLSSSSTPGTYNVTITDSIGNQVTATHTIKSEILLYHAGEHTGALGGRSGADTICQSNKPADAPQANSIALLSTTDEAIKDYPILFGIDSNERIIGGSGTFAANWATLSDSSGSGTQRQRLDTISILPSNQHWWSGTDGDGGYTSAPSTCNNWSSNSSSVWGQYGHSDTQSWNIWVDANSQNCSNSKYLLCIAYD